LSYYLIINLFFMKTMSKLIMINIISAVALGMACLSAQAQGTDSVLTLQKALNIALNKQQILKAKDNYAKASAQAITSAKRDGLPDFVLSAQQAYGTINGLNGLASGLPGLTTIQAGPIAPTQNWNAAFGAIYASNIDWNIFSFGLQRAYVAQAKGFYDRDAAAALFNGCQPVAGFSAQGCDPGEDREWFKSRR
jgi:outer membrane protein TolC